MPLLHGAKHVSSASQKLNAWLKPPRLHLTRLPCCCPDVDGLQLAPCCETSVLHSATLLQERYLEQLMAGPVLSAEEKDVIRWGNNAKITIPKRFSQSGKHAQTYRAATAIECLVSQNLGMRCNACTHCAQQCNQICIPQTKRMCRSKPSLLANITADDH